MRINYLLLIIGFLLPFPTYSQQGDPQLGKIKSPSCVFCHGKSGQSTNPLYPNLKGQGELYLYNAMKAYQNKERQGPLADMMRAQLQKLSDTDLQDIAAFYASQK